MFGNLTNTAQTGDITIASVLLSITVSFALSYLVAILYRWTHKGLSYSQAFTSSLVLLSPIAAVAMMVIGNNLARAFGLAGALTMIRFRTVIKDPKDIAYVFWSLVIGLACGVQLYNIVVFGSILIGLITIYLDKTNFGSIRKHDYILRFYRDINLVGDDVLAQVLGRYLKACFLQVMSARDKGKVFEFSYNIEFFDESKQNLLVQELSKIEGVEKVHLLTASEDVEF